MKRTNSTALVLLLLAGASHAQDQRPLPRGAPEAFVHAALRVHVIAHEDLDPDRLRAFARRDVTLWLETRSNTLRDSTVEHLDRFDDAFVQLRAPLKEADARVLAKAPRAGAWIDASSATPELVQRLPGARRVAVRLSGSLDEALAVRLSALRPALVHWSPGGSIDLLGWSLFRQLPGRKIVAPRPDGLLAVKCEVRSASEPLLEIDVATLLALSSDAFPCSRGTRVIVRPDLEPWLLQSLVVRDPSLELVLVVGRNDALAAQVARFLDALGLQRR